MSLRPLLEIAARNERVTALRSALRSDGTLDAYVSGAMRPYLLAALVEGEERRREALFWRSPRTTAPPVTWRGT